MDQPTRVNPNRDDTPQGDQPEAESADRRRALPSVDRLARAVELRDSTLPRWAVVRAARGALERARTATGDEASTGSLEVECLARARVFASPRPRRVLNATGVVLHTNLGRAPLAAGALEAARDAGAYSDLELDRATGSRGKRLTSIELLACELSGAEAATAVNNNAAALLLALNTLAAGREVIVSRGELVEIGGSFRVPDILERAGVRLVEVGTTNRTHPADYERAIGPDTGMLLKVHRSNFEQSGFVREVGLPGLAEIGRRSGVPVVEDLGSGSFLPGERLGLPAEVSAPGRLRSGADVVCFSGDKLLGGPQAGIILGARRFVDPMRSNPLFRALRLDKLAIAALDWTLRAMLEGREAEIPTLRAFTEPASEVEKRARALAERLRTVLPEALAPEVRETRAPVGGGSLPGFELPSWAVAIAPARGAPALAAALREAEPVPVLARIHEGALVLDLRTIEPGDEEVLEAALATVSRDAWPC